ncbi:MAG: hypothetical protein MMC33_000356 [Icmadophila ericetorum]|nr:hypothetical protein [Icmadophila ericetorum]
MGELVRVIVYENLKSWLASILGPSIVLTSFRSPGFGRSDDRAELGLGFKEFLSKEEAGAVVLMSREAAGKKVAFNHYDPVVPELVKTNDNDVAKYVMVYQYALDTIPDGYDTTVSG